MCTSPASVLYATATVLVVLSMRAPATAAAEAISIRATQPLIQHLRRGSAAHLVPAASQAKGARQARMRRCMQSWDRATQMSKREWKQTCQRVIIQQPGMFGPDPL